MVAAAELGVIRSACPGVPLYMNVLVLRSSFALVVEREPELTRRFYEILFAKYPQVRRLFRRNDPRAQETMLRDALIAVLDNLENAPWLGVTLADLGRKHVDYGVTEVMYDWVGDALLDTLGEVAGDAWTDDCAAAWTEAYGVIARAMKAGAAPRTTASS